MKLIMVSLGLLLTATTVKSFAQGISLSTKTEVLKELDKDSQKVADSLKKGLENGLEKAKEMKNKAEKKEDETGRQVTDDMESMKDKAKAKQARAKAKSDSTKGAILGTTGILFQQKDELKTAYENVKSEQAKATLQKLMERQEATHAETLSFLNEAKAKVAESEKELTEKIKKKKISKKDADIAKQKIEEAKARISALEKKVKQ